MIPILGGMFPFLFWVLRLGIFFALEEYAQAVEKYGDLAYDECFGYVPLLALGGKEDVEHLKKIKMKEHIAVITQLTGGV